MLRCEILKQDQLIKELDFELNQKKRGLASDINIAKSEAAMMLQSHGINAGALDDRRETEQGVQSKASLTG